MDNHIYNEDCLAGLKMLPDNCIDCCVTSPPYWGLRDYGVEGQLGLERTPGEYVAKMVDIFSEVRRVLKSEGTLWLNIGDSYVSGYHSRTDEIEEKHTTIRSRANGGVKRQINKKTGELKLKDLVGIPWMVAFALRSEGWYLRQDIIWSKTSPMPESVTDRCTKSHEYIFLMSKTKKYYYDQEAIKTPLKDSSVKRLGKEVGNQKGRERVSGKTNGNMKAVKFGGNKADGYGTRIHSGKKWLPKSYDKEGDLTGGGKANRRSVWTVATQPFKGAHFATFPPKLIVDCIKAGCPENGIVLDPFMGAGTTALVARKLNRNYVGFELNPEYIEMAHKRLANELGMFK